jgi:hypothetical protein
MLSVETSVTVKLQSPYVPALEGLIGISSQRERHTDQLQGTQHSAGCAKEQNRDGRDLHNVAEFIWIVVHDEFCCVVIGVLIRWVSSSL